MSIESYQTISYVSFFVSGVMLVCTAILFWKLKIPKVIGELTGRTARKAIEELKSQENVYGKNSAMAGKGLHYNELAASLKTGKITEKIFQTTEKMGSTEPLNPTEKLMDAEIEDETRLLEEFSFIPVKQENAGFEITKDEIYIHEEEATELLKE